MARNPQAVLDHQVEPRQPGTSVLCHWPELSLVPPAVPLLKAAIALRLRASSLHHPAVNRTSPNNSSTKPSPHFLHHTAAKMPLEAVMIIADNSESSRNGDYQPTRFDSQADSINILFDSITQGNPESSVGLMSMGGKGPEVLSTLTTERGKLLEGLHRTKKKISGKSHLATGIQIASVSKATVSSHATNRVETNIHDNSWP